jgi:type VI secretion system secreted protein VgrG
MAIQSDRLMQFTSRLGKDVLLLDGLTGTEAISTLFEFRAELLAAADTEINPEQIVGTNVTVAIALSDRSGTRWVNGIVTSFEQGAGDDEYNQYRATIMPSMWQLTLSSNCRVFQDMTVVDVIMHVINEYGLSASQMVSGTYPKLEYCTQYSESDFHFVQRLMQEHGICFWFEHSDSDNRIILADDRNAYRDCPLVSEVKFEVSEKGAEGAYGSRVSEFSMEASMGCGKHSTADYTYRGYQRQDVDVQTSLSKYGKNAYEVYLYPAGEEGYLKDAHTQSTSQLETLFLKSRFLSSESVIEMYRGSGTARTFTPGYTFTLAEHPRDKWNAQYLLVGVTHTAEQVPSYRSREARAGDGYSNRFVAVPATIIYKPPQTVSKPRIYGPQTAKVVAPAGEEIHIDKLGRINVQFFWDKVRKDNTPDNTWVRVAQQWAGNGWGTFFWPRLNDEVIVEFLNGDPDNPVVVGSVYNGTNVPKYELPDHSTRSGLVTRSSKGGSAQNANELRFEDKAGHEQIFLNAEKDMDHRVENDHRLYIGGKDSLTVKGGQFDSVTGDRNSNVGGNVVSKTGGNADEGIGGNLTEKIGGNSSQNVGGNRAEKAGMNYSLDAGMQMYLKAGMTLVIEAGMGITLKGPNGFITLDPAGVSISGAMVLINSGGAALSGSAGSVTDPQSPKDPDEADDGSKGGAKNS